MNQQFHNLIEAQGDYLVFILATLVMFALVQLVVKRLRPAARFPWILLVLALAGLVAGWFLTQSAGKKSQQENIADVSAMAATYAAELEHMGHGRISTNTPADDPLYLELVQAEIRWQKLNPFAHDIYTMRKRPDGTNIFIVDSETDYDHNGRYEGEREQRTPIGKIYEEADEGLEKAFKGEVIFDSEIVNDEWGSWVSAFVPMHDVSGQVEAVLGVDFDAHEWLAGTARARHAAIWVVAFFIALILGCGMGIALLRADITQRIAAERRLRESEERLRLTIRQMPLGFIEWSMAAEVCVWNPSAERIFGHAAAEVEGRKIFPVIVAPSAKDRVDELWDNLVCNAGGTHSVNENITKDGRIILCEWFNTPLVGADGKVTSVFSLFQDITDRVLLEQKLQSSERLSAVGQLSAGVAHDFNNILTVILGHAGLLQGRPGMSGDARQDVRRIEEAATRAASLTRQLLAFSRRQAMFPRTLDLGKTVQDVAGMLSRLIRADMKFQVTIAGNVPPVEADPAMLEQVVTNLVINARDALETPGGDIAVEVDTVEIPPAAVPPFPNACAGRFVRLTVRDNGMGIPAENLARIFEPFFTTKAQGKGTGLGLSVVHGIVEQHGGWISVHSQPGKGTAFAIHLPPSDKPLTVGDTTMLVRPAAPAAKKVRTILLAEDEPFVRELAVKILENAGYAVIAVPDGLCALEKWGKQRDQIDLLFTDMVMPNGIGGRELSERILADQPQLPVIYASGYSIDTTAPGFCESERMLFLQKPYKPEQLLAAVHKCLEQAAA